MKRQLIVYLGLQTILYLPVLAYSLVAIGFALQKAAYAAAVVISIFQLCVIASGTYLIYYRLTNWLKPAVIFSLGFRLPKPFFSLLLFHLSHERKAVLAALKLLSVLLLYIVLVHNSGKADNDSFLLFYLVILLAHFIVPFFLVQFVENNLAFSRNLPLPRIHYATAYIITYCILLLPEFFYLILYGQGLLHLGEIGGYFGVSIAGLFLLTAVQYSEAVNRDEYTKIGFALFFVSIFALHIKAFLPWIGIQLAIGALLFWTGFYSYTPPANEEENKKGEVC